MDNMIEKIKQNTKGLTREQQIWINIYLDNSQHTMTQIVEEVFQLYQVDNGIQLIPKVVLLVSTICHNQSIFLELENTEHLMLLIKLVLDALIELHFVYFPDIEKQMIESIVNTSIDLLKYEITGKTEKLETSCFFSWFFPNSSFCVKTNIKKDTLYYRNIL